MDSAQTPVLGGGRRGDDRARPAVGSVASRLPDHPRLPQLAGEAEQPSWGFLLLLGLIGGGPTFVGTVVGQGFTSDAASVLFLALAAGSILFVIVTLLGVGLRLSARRPLYLGIVAGMAAGFVTDMLVTAGGA